MEMKADVLNFKKNIFVNFFGGHDDFNKTIFLLRLQGQQQWRRGLGVGSWLLNPGVCGSNPGRGVIPLGKEFTTNFLPQVTRCGAGPD